MAKNKGLYPWLKSVFGKKDTPAAAVYAGPAQMNRRRNTAESETDTPDDPVMEDVYAGPEFFEQTPEEPKEEPINLVYAGPSYFKRPGMDKVYAGPEFYKQNMSAAQDKEDTEPEDLEKAGDEDGVEDLKKLDGVEGSDDVPGEELPPPFIERDAREFMAVYAGPEYFNNRNDGAFTGMGFFEIKKVKCQKCGAEYPETNTVCPECGERTVHEDGRIACANCGAHIKPSAKFCENCGAKQV